MVFYAFQNANKLNIIEDQLGIPDIRIVSSEMNRKGHINPAIKQIT
ncbi:hypothetical protein [Candidatus Bealeia paramacronuclearis]